MLVQAPPTYAAPLAVVVNRARPASERILLTSDARSWRTVSPPRVGPIDDVTFVDSRHGWVVSEDCSAGRGEVARTIDGGRTWRTAPFGAHSCGVPSSFTVDFVDARHGWIVELEGTASFTALWRTLDGGRSWRQIFPRLPGNGSVRFSNPRAGWLGGADGLYRTRSAGQRWRRVGAFGGRAFHSFAPPRFFGRIGITAGVSRGAAAAWRTSDGGRHWRRTLLVPASPSLVQPVALSAPNAAVFWLTVAGRRRRLCVSTDGGRSWKKRGTLPPTTGTVQAVDAQTAIAPSSRGRRAVVLVTHDGGRTWRPR